MRKNWLVLFLFPLTLQAEPLQQSVVPHDKPYYTKELRNTQLIYTEDNLPYAKEAAKIELNLQPLYEKKFGYQMDEILHVGLISDYNQIANGFSTQFPNNRQINYVGGAMMVDYFSSPSWLKTLLYHETSHNYQTNAKGNISSAMHSVIGNGAFFIPWFVVPNMVESSFLLEGNAVLNESWHGNGGRLYSGRFRAATLQQAKAGYLTPERVYNDNYYFLYGSHHYTLGSQYQYFLAKNYGLEKVNSYWQEHTLEWQWPFYTNKATERSIGVDFDTAFEEWRKQMVQDASNLMDVDGKSIASTQFYTPVNDDEKEIYFIVNESGREFPQLVVYDKKSGKTTKTKTSHSAGKVIKLADGRYVTQASVKTSPWRIYQGLFDESAFVIDGSQSKVIEGYLNDGTEVYFDVSSSFDQPQLYVGEDFYVQTNSSVHIDKDDNLYYFVQGEEKYRTLYKNKEALFNFNGYYSYVSGIDSKGAVYFIANTTSGSGLYRYHDGKISRAHKADTIFDARLIDDTSAMVSVMGSDEYSFKKISLSDIDEAPYDVKLYIENDPDYRADDISIHQTEIPAIDLDKPYNSFFEMNYSGTDLHFANDSEAGFIYNFTVKYSDPLTQNAMSGYLLRNLDEYALGGVSYANNQFYIQFALDAYGVIDRPDIDPALGEDEDRRDWGLVAQAQLPFWQVGHYKGIWNATFYQDYESGSRKPFSSSIDLMRMEHYGASQYRNFYLYASPYASSERGDTSVGGEAAFEHSFLNEFYFAISTQYSSSDAETYLDSRGVKLTKNLSDKFIDSDPTTVIMHALKATSYFESVSKSSVEFKKVLNLSSYYFVAPSLRRESIYARYNYYDLEPFGASVKNEQANEVEAGIIFDTFWVNKIPIPISLAYIYNDNETLAEKESVRFYFGFRF